MAQQLELDWDTLVEERNAWIAHNFPDPYGKRTPLDSVLGVIEELGELTHAHLKQVQSIRGTDEEHEANAKDAIGDLTVYLLGVMSYVGWDNHWLALGNKPDADDALLRLANAVGGLADDMFTARLKARGSGKLLREFVPYIVYGCECYCQARGWNYREIVTATWNSVKKRDWIKFPKDGLTQ